MPLYACVNIHGPDGELVKAGQPLPDDWDTDIVASLKATGGAASKKDAEAFIVAGWAGADPGFADALQYLAAKDAG